MDLLQQPAVAIGIAMVLSGICGHLTVRPIYHGASKLHHAWFLVVILIWNIIGELAPETTNTTLRFGFVVFGSLLAFYCGYWAKLGWYWLRRQVT